MLNLLGESDIEEFGIHADLGKRKCAASSYSVVLISLYRHTTIAYFTTRVRTRCVCHVGQSEPQLQVVLSEVDVVQFMEFGELII